MIRGWSIFFCWNILKIFDKPYCRWAIVDFSKSKRYFILHQKSSENGGKSPRFEETDERVWNCCECDKSIAVIICELTLTAFFPDFIDFYCITGNKLLQCLWDIHTALPCSDRFSSTATHFRPLLRPSHGLNVALTTLPSKKKM